MNEGGPKGPEGPDGQVGRNGLTRRDFMRRAAGAAGLLGLLKGIGGAEASEVGGAGMFEPAEHELAKHELAGRKLKERVRESIENILNGILAVRDLDRREYNKNPDSHGETFYTLIKLYADVEHVPGLPNEMKRLVSKLSNLWSGHESFNKLHLRLYGLQLDMDSEDIGISKYTIEQLQELKKGLLELQGDILALKNDLKATPVLPTELPKDYRVNYVKLYTHIKKTLDRFEQNLTNGPTLKYLVKQIDVLIEYMTLWLNQKVGNK